MVRKTLALAAAGAFAANLMAAPILINDNYIGSDDHGYGDVIGEEKWFGVGKMEVTQSGDLLTVDVSSVYFNNIGKYGTSLGDLFISTDGYSAPPNSLNDDYTNGEGWEYGLALDAHDGSKSSGTATLYAIDDISDITLSYAPSGYIHRDGQEIRVNTSNAAATGATGSWSLVDAGGDNGYLSLSMNLSDLGSTDLGLRWTMSCANDVIEGGAQIPEPSAVSLLGVALVGLALVRRRRRV